MLVKAEVTPLPKDGPVKKAVPSQFPLLERVKGKSSGQLKALEESFQKSSSPTEAELGKACSKVSLTGRNSCVHDRKSIFKKKTRLWVKVECFTVVLSFKFCRAVLPKHQ